jgi:hypothetical protein
MAMSHDVVMVDELRPWPTTIRCFREGSCHLTVQGSLETLHQFAAKIGLQRDWFQPKSTPHYDLTASKRKKALAAGAIFIPGREQAKARIRAREEALAQQREQETKEIPEVVPPETQVAAARGAVDLMQHRIERLGEALADARHETLRDIVALRTRADKAEQSRELTLELYWLLEAQNKRNLASLGKTREELVTCIIQREAAERQRDIAITALREIGDLGVSDGIERRVKTALAAIALKENQ